MATSADGQWAVTAGADGQVLVWPEQGDPLPVRPTYELQGSGGAVSSAFFFGDGVLALEANGTMRHWNLPRPPRFTGHSNWVLDLDLSRDGHELATASSDGYGFIIDPTDITTSIARFGDGDPAPLQAVRFDPTDAHRIFSLSRYANGPQLWQWSAGQPSTQPINFDPAPLDDYKQLVDIAVSPDGSTVAAGDATGGLHFWDSYSGRLLKERWQPGNGYGAFSLAYDPSGRWFAVTIRDGVRLIGSDGSQRVLKLPNATAVTFDATGDQVAAAADGGTVRVWSTINEQMDEFIGHGSHLGRLSFSPDGSLLAAGTADGLVEVWDIRTGVILTLTGQHSDSVNEALFAPGSNARLISASDDETVAEWPCAACADPDTAIQAAVAAEPGG